MPRQQQDRFDVSVSYFEIIRIKLDYLSKLQHFKIETV